MKCEYCKRSLKNVTKDHKGSLYLTCTGKLICSRCHAETMLPLSLGGLPIIKYNGEKYLKYSKAKIEKGKISNISELIEIKLDFGYTTTNKDIKEKLQW